MFKALVVFAILLPGLYSGIFAQCLQGDCINGVGVYQLAGGEKYEGGFKNGNKHGHGIYTWANGDKYEGNFEEGVKHGRGILYYSDGSKYDGMFNAGKMEGYGVYYFSTGNKYLGEFKDNLKHGKGTYVFSSGEAYDGTWELGNRVGEKKPVKAPTDKEIAARQGNSTAAPQQQPAQQTTSKALGTKQPVYHVVQPQETIYRIATNYNVSQDDLRRWNSLASNNVNIGQKLVVGYKEENAVSNNPSVAEESAALQATTPQETAKSATPAAQPKQQSADEKSATASVAPAPVATSSVTEKTSQTKAAAEITTQGMALPAAQEPAQSSNQKNITTQGYSTSSASGTSGPTVRNATTEVKNGVTELTTGTVKYRRSSLYTMMVHDPYRRFADTIKNAYLQADFPEKYNNHNLALRSVTIANQTKETEDKIKNYLDTAGVARALVAQWFNRSERGTFNMQLVADRGQYNASEMDAALAKKTIRGASLLSDAGEELIGNTFVVVTDFKFTDKEVVADVTKGLIRAVLEGVKVNDKVINVSDTVLTTVGKGYFVKATSYLFRLNWNDSIANIFYQNYWMDDVSFDPARKTAFDNSKLFTLSYIGSDNDLAGEQSATFLGKTQEQLIMKATIKAAEKALGKLQKKYEVFRTKTPLASIEPMSAKIGLKEGIDKNDRFQVLEQEIDENGKTTYKKVGVIKVDKERIWDNRYVAADETPPQSDIDCTYFEGTGKKFYPGMLIKQIN